MPKFLNKNELVLLMLIILLFDLNGFCEGFIPYIVNPKKRNYVLVSLMAIIVLYSIYVYHSICHYVAPPSVKYKVSDKHDVLSCIEQVDDAIEKNQEMVDEMKYNCNNVHINTGTYLAEKLVLTLIPVIILTFVFIAIYKVEDGDGVNSENTRILLSVPLILLSCSILSFAHIYIPFFSKE